MPTNRVVAIATVVLSLLAAAVPALGNFDWTSTAGVLAGIVGMAAVVLKWLDGWQKAEARVADPMLHSVEGDPEPAVVDPIL